MNPEHELRTRELIAELWPEAQVSLSHEVLPRWREYERTSTTVLDAYLKPLMRDYMRSLEQDCDAGGIDQLLVLRSNGGVMTPGQGERAARRARPLRPVGRDHGLAAARPARSGSAT